MSVPAAKHSAPGSDPVKNLQDAIDWAETNYPLPRCRHGKALKDAAGDLLEPPCGCHLQGCVIVCPPEPEKDAGSWEDYQHIKHTSEVALNQRRRALGEDSK